MRPNAIQTRAISQALCRLIETDGQVFHSSDLHAAWRVNNRELIRLLRMAFPGVEARGAGPAYCRAPVEQSS